MREHIQANPGETAEQRLAYRKLLENPYTSGNLDPGEVQRRGALLAAGDTTAAYQGLPYGPSRLPILNAIAQAAQQANPDAARSSKAVQSVLDWQDRTKSITKLANIKVAMQQRQVQAYKAMDVVEQYADKVKLGTNVPLNILTVDVKTLSSDQNTINYLAAVQTLVREYSGAINPSGSSRVYDEQRAVQMINSAFGNKAMHSLMGLLKQEIGNSISAADTIRQAEIEGRSVMEVLSGEQGNLGDALPAPGGGGGAVDTSGGWSIQKD